MLNAAVWLGTALFYTAGVAPALVSSDMLGLLGPKNFAFFSGSISQIVLNCYFYWLTGCAVVALLHLLVEWVYLGRAVHRFWPGLLGGLLALGLLGGVWLAPKLAKLHRAGHKLDALPEDRVAAAKSFRFWHGVLQTVNLMMVGGVAVYFWRATNPSDSLRFVGPAKFRG